MADLKRTTCFVVIPYGKKPVGGGEQVDFERVFLDLIVPACYRLTDWNIAVERAKDDPASGIVSERFINDILAADLCIVDISGFNPNVFYELGLRHAFAGKTTVLVGGKVNAPLPFDISGISCFWYNIQDERSRIESVAAIAQGIDKALRSAIIDSPVYKFLPDLRLSRPTTACKTREEVLFRVAGNADKQIGIITGALNEVAGVDIWVNSENTEMEMARPMARSISSVIRYWGAKRRQNGQISRDLIQIYLKGKMGSRNSVAPATVLDTPPGELKQKGVQHLLHVATASGQPGRGYQAVPDLGQCVRNCLARATELNQRRPGQKLSSILFPLFGTGEGGQNLDAVFPEYLDICIEHLKTSTSNGLSKILFLAFTEHERDYLFKKMAFHKDLQFASEANLEQESVGSDVGESATTLIEYIDGVLIRAKIARDKKNLDEELKHLEKALETIKASRWLERFSDDRTLVKVGERVSDVYARTGGVYRRMGKLQEALACLRKGAEIESSDSKFHRFTYNSVNRIVLEFIAGYSSAMALREDLHDLDQRLGSLVSDERKSDAWAWADLAVIKLLLGDLEASRLQIEQSLALYPDTWPSLRYTLHSLATAAASNDRPHFGGLRDVLVAFDSKFALTDDTKAASAV